MNQPVTDDEGRPLDQIRLEGLFATGYHGVFEHERRDGQPFGVDVVLHLDTRPAAATDDLADTVDYGRLAVTVGSVVRGEPVDLIERLAERIAQACLADDRVAAVDVAVHKPGAPIPEQFSDVVVSVRRTRLDRTPPAAVVAVLALGANLGDRAATLQAAIDDLNARPGVAVTRVSPIVETAPVGGPDQPDYLNAVIQVSTTRSPLELLEDCHRVEQLHFRDRQTRWAARTLDIDLITYGDLTSMAERLTLPHPRAWMRAFVLAPWTGIDAQARLGGQPVAQLLAGAPDRDGVRPRPDLTLTTPTTPTTPPR